MIVLAAALNGWPLAAVTILVGLIIGAIVGAVASASSINDLELRIRILRRELRQIARHPEDAESYALGALARDNLLRDGRNDERPADAEL